MAEIKASTKVKVKSFLSKVNTKVFAGSMKLWELDGSTVKIPIRIGLSSKQGVNIFQYQGTDGEWAYAHTTSEFFGLAENLETDEEFICTVGLFIPTDEEEAEVRDAYKDNQKALDNWLDAVENGYNRVVIMAMHE